MMLSQPPAPDRMRQTRTFTVCAVGLTGECTFYIGRQDKARILCSGMRWHDTRLVGEENSSCSYTKRCQRGTLMDFVLPTTT